jgi:hypothetical protein
MPRRTSKPSSKPSSATRSVAVLRVLPVPAPATPGKRLVTTTAAVEAPAPAPSTTAATTAPTKPTPTGPFRLLDLPSELRLKIYTYHFSSCPPVLDLERTNKEFVRPYFSLLRTCRLVYREAVHHFWSTHAVRVFPTTPGRPFKTKRPLLARLKPHQRQSLSSLELRLGPGWSEPPPGWVVNDALGLADCVRVRRLRIFLECDPSDGVFAGFRRAEGFYEGFCVNLLNGILARVPSIHVVEFDAWPSVRKSGGLMATLRNVVRSREDLAVCWGAERGWTDGEDEVKDKELTFDEIMNGMSASLASFDDLGAQNHGIVLVA